MTRGELLSELAVMLGAPHEARFIVEDVLGPAPWLGSGGVDVSADDVDTVCALAERRSSGEPLQYVLGHWAFRSLDLLVDPRVLIPRPETEQVVEVALEQLRLLNQLDPIIVDAGTGSGAIALSFATELSSPHAKPTGQIWAVDCSADALEVAAANLDRVSQVHQGHTVPVSFIEGSWLTALPTHLRGTVTLVVSNPPYVAADEWTALSPEVHCEPVGALISEAATDGTPGLGDVETVLRQSLAWLGRPGVVVIELAPHQAEAAVALAISIGYSDVHVVPDLADRPRSLVGQVR
jgi:release factor glutamine methyltransferase